LANFEVVNHLLNQTEAKADIMGTTLVPHIIPAVQGRDHTFGATVKLIKRRFLGFFRSIALRSVNSLQDTLRLLTLWFKFGVHDEVSQAIASGFSTVEVDTWLEVIPQVNYPLHFPISP
jgi:serine/threonine-protein kinase mTOR